MLTICQLSDLKNNGNFVHTKIEDYKFAVFFVYFSHSADTNFCLCVPSWQYLNGYFLTILLNNCFFSLNMVSVLIKNENIIFVLKNIINK